MVNKNSDPTSENINSAKDSGKKLNSSLGNDENLSPNQDSHLFKCRSCGYVYDPEDGIKKLGIIKGTPFSSFDPMIFKCPVCRLGVEFFTDIGPKSQPSGFKENLDYGFGLNKLTEGQKNVLIFGGLAFAFACFLSLYSLH